MAKYPRTPHLPYSPGGTSDDRRIANTKTFLNRPLIITEKMDGSNVCLEQGNCFARSHSSAPNHPSFDALKSLHATVKHKIGEGIQVFGEWLYAKHSIAYDKLPAYLMLFGVRDAEKDMWASWEETVIWAEDLEVITAPVLYEGFVCTESELQSLVERLAVEPSVAGQEREGVVVRLADEFSDADFNVSVAKWVRSNHVQTDDHWKNQAIVRNGLG